MKLDSRSVELYELAAEEPPPELRALLERLDECRPSHSATSFHSRD